jgi:hypothetical protein
MGVAPTAAPTRWRAATCAPTADAVAVEGLRLRNLSLYVDDLDAWLVEQVADRRLEQHRREQAVERL